jgi:hydroxymethylpyrimidine/phosphomethylpyrimidine kinase
LTGTAPIFAVWPLNSCHAAHHSLENSARSALRFVRRAVMNALNIKQSIVSNALKPVTSALKNAEKWQRNNTYLLLSAIPPAMKSL